MTTLMDRLLGRTGWHRRTSQDWAAMEQDVAKMADQDRLIGELVRQRDEHRNLAAAASQQVEEFRQRVTDAEERADRAEQAVTRLRSELANARAITVPMYATESPTLEQLPITPVVSLQARGAA